MKIYNFHNPFDYRFAVGGRRGKWTPSEGLCPTCGASSEVRAQPLLLAWEPGSDEIGDFTWPGVDSDVVATDAALDVLKPFPGFEPGPVEFVEDVPAPKKRAKRVVLPYTGPRLHELWVTTWVNIDRDRSSVELEHECPTCGRQRWALYGVEEWHGHYDRDLGRYIRVKSERFPNAGMFLCERDLQGAGIFRVHEFPGPVFCTEDVRDAVVEAGLSNVSFLEVGDTF